ncbi:hypothetical protein [Clostridium sp. FP1]|nr:hypothetical protein [Clostridium sp. FP1]
MKQEKQLKNFINRIIAYLKKEFNEEGYSHNEYLSSDTEFVFTR